MKKAIEIQVLRVSSNGKYIEFIINCPKDYYFSDFTVQVYGEDSKYSLKDCLFEVPVGIPFDEDTMVHNEIDEITYWNRHYYAGQFLISDLDVNQPEMYEIHLKAYHNEEADSELEDAMECQECWDPKPVLELEVYISDVSNVYDCLMHDILQMDKDLCKDEDAQDKLIRNYLVLYAHQEAMLRREPKEAKRYFNLLRNCFSKCGNKYEGCDICGNSNYSIYKPSNCGCGK